MTNIFFFIGQLLLETAFAANPAPPLPPCTVGGALFGCAQTASNVLATNVFPELTIFFLRVAAAGSVAFIIYSGIVIISSQGDSSKVSSAKSAIMYSLGGLILALSSQLLVGFVATQYQNPAVLGATDNFIFAGILAATVDMMIRAVNAMLFVIVILQGYKMVTAQGKSDQFNEARSALLAAVAGAVVVNISVALVNAVLLFFGL